MNDKKPIIQVRDLHKAFRRDLHVLKGIDMDVEQGEVVVIIGPSGSGKSTFLRCLNFLEEPTAGTVEIDGVLIPAGSHRPENTRTRSGKSAPKPEWCFSNSTCFPT